MSHVRICRAELQLSQQNHNEEQFMTVEIEDTGEGPYVVLHTDRWVVDFVELDSLITKLVNLKEMYDKT